MLRLTPPSIHGVLCSRSILRPLTTVMLSPNAAGGSETRKREENQSSRANKQKAVRHCLAPQRVIPRVPDAVVVGINEPLIPLFPFSLFHLLTNRVVPHDVEIHLSEATTSHLFLTVTSSSLSVSHGLSSPLQSLSQILSTSSPTSFNASAA